MKKALIFILISYHVCNIPIRAQPKVNSNDTICRCEIPNLKVKEIINEYIARNQVHANKNGVIPFVKFYSLGNTKDYYKFVISEQRFARDIMQTKPKAYTLIKGFPILIYGFSQKFECVAENYKNFYKSTFRKFLIGDLNEDSKITRKSGLVIKEDVNFDPEVLEVIVDKDTLISSNELSVRPTLK